MGRKQHCSQLLARRCARGFELPRPLQHTSDLKVCFSPGAVQHRGKRKSLVWHSSRRDNKRKQHALSSSVTWGWLYFGATGRWGSQRDLQSLSGRQPASKFKKCLNVATCLLYSDYNAPCDQIQMCSLL